MKKRVFSLFIALFIICGCALTVSAAEDKSYIIDYSLVLSDEEKTELNSLAKQVYSNYGIEAYAVTTELDGLDIAVYADTLFSVESNKSDGVVLVTDTVDFTYYVHTVGRAENMFSDSQLNKIGSAYGDEETYYERFKNFYNELSYQLDLNGVDTIPQERQRPRLVDDAGILTETEKTDLTAKLDEISERLQCDVAVAVVNSLEGKTAQVFADDYYDYNGYGMGSGDDGVLLLLSMGERKWAVSTYGTAFSAINDTAMDYLTDNFTAYLRDDEYYTAFETYADDCDTIITKYENGTPFSEKDAKGNLPIVRNIIISVIAGLIISFIITFAMKSKLKTVRRKYNASDYTVPGSMNITNSSDMYLYRTVSKVKIEKNDGGGSSSHTSSSGRSHGGSSGSF